LREIEASCVILQLTAILTSARKYPQFPQSDIYGLSDAFRKLDVDDKGYVDEATAIKAAQNSERQPYDVVRQALKEVELDSSRRVELDDYVDLIARLRESSPAQQRSRGLSNAVKPDAASAPTPAPSHASKGSIGGAPAAKASPNWIDGETARKIECHTNVYSRLGALLLEDRLLARSTPSTKMNERPLHHTSTRSSRAMQTSGISFHSH
jgi:hypothetical protein